MSSASQRKCSLGLLALLGLVSWWFVREPTRARYLASVTRQLHHLPGRYAT